MRPREEHRPNHLDPFLSGCRAVVILMEPGETEEQAWQRYSKKHPEDVHADILIFSFAEVIFRSSILSRQ
jgi:hypothetical protein